MNEAFAEAYREEYDTVALLRDLAPSERALSRLIDLVMDKELSHSPK